MLLNRKDQVQSTVVRLANEAGVLVIELYDKTGRIAFASDPSRVGEKVTKGDRVCVTCHLDDGTRTQLPMDTGFRLIRRDIALDIASQTAGCVSPPTANAGADRSICEDITLNLSGSIGGSASSATWSTTGDGTFANNTSLSTDYTPGTNDLTNGTVTFTLTTDDPDGAGPCLAATDDIIITFESPHTADAGIDQTVCQGDPVTLAGIIGGSALSGQPAVMGASIMAHYYRQLIRPGLMTILMAL